MVDPVEVVKALVSPAEKLIDSISGAIGKIYEPHHLKKMAEAQSYKIKKLGEAIRENSDIPIECNQDGVMLSSTDYDQFLKRTEHRLAFQELKKQENIETIAGKAYNLLEGETAVTDDTVEQDWILRFFNTVADVSNEQMQDIWAKILAGEVKEPGTFSMRTLSTLHNLTQREALAFNELCQHCLFDEDSCFIYNEEHYMNKYGISFSTILALSECGLINDQSLVRVKHSFEPGISAVFRTDDYIAVIHVSEKDERKISFPLFNFTSAGVQLAKVIGCHMALDEFKEVAKAYQAKATGIIVSVHKVRVNGTVMSFNQHDLLSE